MSVHHTFQTASSSSAAAKTDGSNEAAPPPESIPNLVHFLFGLKADFGGKPFSLVHYLAVKSAFDVQRPTAIYLHYIHLPTGNYWWEMALPYVTLRPVNESTVARVRASTPLVTGNNLTNHLTSQSVSF